MSEAKMTGRKVNKPGCATVRNQATALFSLPMRLGQHVHGGFPDMPFDQKSPDAARTDNSTANLNGSNGPRRIIAPPSPPNISVTDLILGLKPQPPASGNVKGLLSTMHQMAATERETRKNKAYMMYTLKGDPSFV